MLFSEEDTPHLKKWIVKRLENTSDADPDVLADYVVALLRHNGDTETVRRLCEEEIPDFLKEGSSVFVSDVFDALKYKSYLPGAPQPSSHLITSPTGQSSIIPGLVNASVTSIPRGPQNGLRKRSYNDREEPDCPDGRTPQSGGDVNGRFFKQPRRTSDMGRGGRFDNYGSGRGTRQGQPSPMQIPQMPASGFSNLAPIPSPSSGIAPLDPSNQMATFLAMQTMGFPLPGIPTFPQPTSTLGQPESPVPGYQPTNKKTQRCRDYDTKGFCARGNACMYEHGTESIYMPPNIVEEYDPHNSLMTAIDRPSTSPGVTTPQFSNFDSPRGNDRGRGRGRIQRGDRGSSNGAPSRRGGRAEFSSDRPNFDRSNTTIIVENIPEEKFSEDTVRSFFTEFGSIIEVSMRPYKRLALVKYEDWSSAKAAYSSPKVIFDNRFVKVYWYTNPESSQAPLATNKNEALSGTNGTPMPTTVTATSESHIDLEEFTRKQKEAQKAHEEKMKKKAEMEVAQKELERRQEELLKKQAEEKRKLMEKLAAKGSKLSTPSEIEQNGTKSADHAKPSSQTESLKAQLAALEAEAKSLGLDTALADDAIWGIRGRSRGRGAYRGRGFIPRGRGFERGGYRGRGAPFFGGVGATYKLDNRPRKVSLVGIDFTDPERDESLRQYLLGVGEFTNIETTHECTFITFKDRFTAEKFMYGMPGGEIPSVGKVELAWVQTTMLPSTSPSGVNNLGKSDEIQSEGDAIMQDSTPTHGDGQGQRHHQDLDYDVADDNDWGTS